MKYMKYLMVAMMALMMSVSGTMAQDYSKITVNRNDLTPEQLQKYERQAQVSTPERAKEWVGVGKELGVAVREGLSAVTDETAKFANTSVGKLTMYLIVYKVVGKDMIHYGGTILFFFIFTTIWLYSFYKCCITRSVLSHVEVDEKGKKHYTYHVINEPSGKYGDEIHATRGFHLATILVVYAVIGLVMIN